MSDNLTLFLKLASVANISVKFYTTGNINLDDTLKILDLINTLKKLVNDNSSKLIAELAFSIAKHHEENAIEHIESASKLSNKEEIKNYLIQANSEFNMAIKSYKYIIKGRKIITIEAYKAIFYSLLSRSLCFYILYQVADTGADTGNDKDFYKEEFIKNFNETIYSFYASCWFEISSNRTNIDNYYDYTKIFNIELKLTKTIDDLKDEESELIEQSNIIFGINKWDTRLVTYNIESKTITETIPLQPNSTTLFGFISGEHSLESKTVVVSVIKGGTFLKKQSMLNFVTKLKESR